MKRSHPVHGERKRADRRDAQLDLVHKVAVVVVQQVENGESAGDTSTMGKPRNFKSGKLLGLPQQHPSILSPSKLKLLELPRIYFLQTEVLVTSTIQQQKELARLKTFMDQIRSVLL
jgi:hypothetical protein